MSSSVVIDSETFFKRVGLICEKLKTEEFQDVNALLVTLGNPTDFTVYQKSTAIFSWLLGYEFPETVLLITADKVAFLASHKKVQILDSLKASHEGMEIVTIGRDKEANRSSLQFEKLHALIKDSSRDGEKIKVGILQKDKNEGAMIEEWSSFFTSKSGECEVVDVASSLSTLLSQKDSQELKLIDSAAKTSSVIMKEHVMPKILSIVDEGKKISHSKLSDDFENAITNQLKKLKTKLPATLNTDFVDICYPPIVQSGGVFSLKPSALSNDDAMMSGIIVCSLGARYKSYCSNVGRTFLIDPSKDQERNYQFLLDLQKHLMDEMKVGVQISTIYAKAHQYVENNRPELKNHLPNNLGFGMGLEFRESDFVINAKNNRELKAGMIFNLIIGLQELDNPEASNSKGKIYALLLADTIEIEVEGGAKCLTPELKSLNQVSYSLGSEQEQKEARKNRVAQVASESVGTRPKLRAQQKMDEASERKRREHQKELARVRLLEAQELYAQSDENSSKKSGDAVQKFESYKKDSMWPKDLKGNRVFIDKRNDTVIFPVNGLPVPFHIATIKNVTKNEEGKSIFLRVNFVTPGRSFGRKEAVTFMDPAGHFLRSLTVRTNDLVHAQGLVKDITDLRKQFVTREATKKEMADIVEQESLIEITGRRPYKLPEISVRPALEGRRLPGDVEIHSNGIRYKMQLKADQKIDVLFSNVKHLFFQPCDNEMTVIVHLHLKTPIMVGKKKTKDIQFYREALENHVEETGGRRRKTNYGDEDEIAQEREEKRRRQQANDEFKSFAEKISEAFKGLEVEIPFRDLGFNGVPSRQTVLLQPTTECLVYLSEPPYTIVTLNEVEIAYLERVMFGLKNFDLVFIFKDHTIAPVHITAIPMANLEAVKDWLDSVDVLFAESTVNYNWTNIMKTVVEDPTGFYEMGGWSYLQPDADNGDDSDEDEQSSEYEPEEDDDEEFEDSEEEEEEEDDDEEDDDEDEEFEDSEDDEDEGSDEESGSEVDSEDDAPDWDELEKRTRREDSKREKNSVKRKAPPASSKSAKRR